MMLVLGLAVLAATLFLAYRMARLNFLQRGNGGAGVQSDSASGWWADGGPPGAGGHCGSGHGGADAGGDGGGGDGGGGDGGACH